MTRKYEDLAQGSDNKYERIRRDLSEELIRAQNELRETRVELDRLKFGNSRLTEAEQEIQR